MKKLILAVLACASFFAANAQQPNSILLYGNVGFHSASDAYSNSTINWNVNPGIGYQFNEHWTLGLNLGWHQSSLKRDSSSDRLTTNTYNVGVFGRYSSFISGSKTFFWFAQLNAGYEGSYTTFGGDPAYDKSTGFNVNVLPAIGVMVCKGLALNMSIGGLGFNSHKLDGANNSSSAFNFTFGHDVNIGISKNFGCHHMHHGHHEMGEDTRHIDTSDDGDDDAPKKKHKHHKKDKDEDE